MAKDQVYSWRLSSETKVALERAARRANQSLGALLESIVRGWLRAAGANGTDAAEQQRLHDAAFRCVGVLHFGKQHRAENARRLIRARIAARHGRRRTD